MVIVVTVVVEVDVVVVVVEVRVVVVVVLGAAQHMVNRYIFFPFPPSELEPGF